MNFILRTRDHNDDPELSVLELWIGDVELVDYMVYTKDNELEKYKTSTALLLKNLVRVT